MIRAHAMTTTELYSETIPEPNTGCWLWAGAVNNTGYGTTKHGRERMAHRVSYSLSKGPIPEGLCVMHACDTPLCVNPDHLRVGSRSENSADMHRKARHLRSRTWKEGRCNRGHDITRLGSVRVKKDGFRQCRVCVNDAARSTYRRNKEAVA